MFHVTSVIRAKEIFCKVPQAAISIPPIVTALIFTRSVAPAPSCAGMHGDCCGRSLPKARHFYDNKLSAAQSMKPVALCNT